MSTKKGIYMMADGLEVEDIGERVTPVGPIEKLDRVKNLDVVLSFWGTTENSSKKFKLLDELKNFEKELEDSDDVLTVSEKIKEYFEELDVLEDQDNLGFHICGYINDIAHIHHVHHISSFEKNRFKNEDSKQEFQSRVRYIDHPILFNGDNKIPNLIINLIGVFEDRIKYEDFSSDQAEEFLIFLMETAIQLQKFSSNSLTSGILIDYPLRFCSMNKDDIRLKVIRE